MYYIKTIDVHKPEDGLALFGPFPEDQIDIRMKDKLADMYRTFGPVEKVELSEEDLKDIYVNSDEDWITFLGFIEMNS